MIPLSMQIKSIVFSIFYGILISFLFNISYFLLFNKKKIIKLFCSIVFVIDVMFLYFYVLEHINYRYIHIYLLLFFFLGYIMLYAYFKNKFRKIRVKK